MQLLDLLLGHDHDATAELLARCADLTPAQLDQPFDAGHGSLRATLDHLIYNIEAWGDDIRGVAPVKRPRGTSLAELVQRHEAAYADLAAAARTLQAEGRLEELWSETGVEQPIQRAYGATILHVITHSMHHRAEIQHMLHRVGLPDVPEGDLIAWSQDQRAAAS